MRQEDVKEFLCPKKANGFPIFGTSPCKGELSKSQIFFLTRRPSRTVELGGTTWQKSAAAVLEGCETMFWRFPCLFLWTFSLFSRILPMRLGVFCGQLDCDWSSNADLGGDINFVKTYFYMEKSRPTWWLLWSVSPPEKNCWYFFSGWK